MRGAPEPYFCNMAENVFTHIVFRNISDVFDEIDYNKNVNITHIFIYCCGVVLASYRIYNTDKSDIERSKKILHAINHFSFNNVYPMIIDNFGFKSLKEASEYFVNLSDYTYAYAIQDAKTIAVVSVFLQNTLIDKRDTTNTVILSALTVATEKSVKEAVSYFATGRMP